MSSIATERADPEQREPGGRSPAAASARTMAAELSQVVAGDGPRRFSGARRLSAHGDERGRRRLGELRLRQDAGLSLGHLPGRSDHRPHDRVRRRLRQARLARSAGRTPKCAAPADRDPGRHRAGERRAAAEPRPDLPELVRPPKSCFRSTSRRGATSGRWCICCTRTSAGTAAKKPKPCSNAAAATPEKPRILGAFNAPIEDWLSFFMFTYFTDRDGKYQLLALSESAFDPLAEPRASCSPRKRITCSSANPA